MKTILDLSLWIYSFPFALLAIKYRSAFNHYYYIVKYRRRLRNEPEWQLIDWEILKIPPPKN